MPAVPPIKEFREPTPRFRKSYRKLNQETRDEFEKVLNELIAGEVPRGRRYKHLSSYGDQIGVVRLNRSYRFAFLKHPEDGTAWPIAIGPHDEVYEALPRRDRRRDQRRS